MSEKHSTTIALMTTHFPPKRGGVETSNVQYLKSAAAMEDLTLEVITYQRGQTTATAPDFARDHVHYVVVPERVFDFILSPESIARIDVAGFGKKAMYLLGHLIYMLKGAFEHRRVIRKSQLILANGALAEGLPAWFTSFLFRRPLVLRWRTDIAGFLVSPLVQTCVKCVFTRASQIHVNGSDMVKQMEKALGVPTDKIHVRRNGVDLSICRTMDRDSCRASLDLEPQAFTILYACALDETSAADYVIEMLDDLMTQDHDIRAVFIGSGPLRSDLDQLAHKHRGRIRHLDQLVSQDTLVQYINAATLVIAKADVSYPSRLAIEAVACGTPTAIPMRPTSAVTGRRDTEELTLDLPDEYFRFLPSDPADGAERLRNDRDDIVAMNAPGKRSAMRQFIEHILDADTLVSEELTAMSNAARP